MSRATKGKGVDQLATHDAPEKHTRPATSIPIDPDKLRLVLRRRFINNREASELAQRCGGWMDTVLHKKRINYYALDDLATALQMNFLDLFGEVVDEEAWLDL